MPLRKLFSFLRVSTQFLSASFRRRLVAQAWRRMEFARFHFRNWIAGRRKLLGFFSLIFFLGICFLLVLLIRNPAHFYFTPDDRLNLLRTLLATVGGALIGATAIGFSVVMLAVQINFARMPYGLFRKLSSDLPLLGAFAGTFLLALCVSGLSLIPDASWAGPSLIASLWCTWAILILFLFAYRRALGLINPGYQLQLIVDSVQTDLRRWSQRAQRMRPLLETNEQEAGPSTMRTTHDTPRVAFFRHNPQWTAASRREIAHAISFARRYAEEGDHEVSGLALTAVIAINKAYIEAKGRTFFYSPILMNNPLASDVIINESLEGFRQYVQAAVSRSDEEQIRQAFRALAALANLYIKIDYSMQYPVEKQHAALASSYLANAVQSALPHNMPDVVMEGVRLMGTTAQALLSWAQPNEIATLAEKIAVVGAVGSLKESHQPLVLTGMEQLAQLTFNLLLVKSTDISFAVETLRQGVSSVAQIFLTVPDPPFADLHGSLLAPYYSLTQHQTFPDQLAKLAAELADAERGNERAEIAIEHIEQWADGLHKTEKELLLTTIQRRSHFSFHIIHWIANITKLLALAASSPACNDDTREKIMRHAVWLISTFSFVPYDRESVKFIETFRMTELLFEVALDAQIRGWEHIYDATFQLLEQWGFVAGRYTEGRNVLKRSIYALVTLVAIRERTNPGASLLASVAARLVRPDAPEQDIRDRTARSLRERGKNTNRSRREFTLSRIESAMNNVDSARLQLLLDSIAELLSPVRNSKI